MTRLVTRRATRLAGRVGAAERRGFGGGGERRDDAPDDQERGKEKQESAHAYRVPK